MGFHEQWNGIDYKTTEITKPRAVAAAFSKALCIHGIFQAVVGNMQVETKHPEAFEITTGSSTAGRTGA